MKSNITQYRIKIDEQTIPIPYNSSFEEVFQIFFACFHVFDYKYSYNIAHFMEFFDVYIFKTKEGTNSMRLKEIFIRLQPNITLQ